MKPSTFSDQAKQIASWFQGWNPCEQTIVLYSLLGKVTTTQAKFLALALEENLKNGHDLQELSRMENDANNPGLLVCHYTRLVCIYTIYTLYVLFVSLRLLVLLLLFCFSLFCIQ